MCVLEKKTENKKEFDILFMCWEEADAIDNKR